MFVTIEDETGPVNIIFWNDIFERERKVVVGSTLLGVQGVWQSEAGVMHLLAKRATDYSRLLGSSPLLRATFTGSLIQNYCAPRSCVCGARRTSPTGALLDATSGLLATFCIRLRHTIAASVESGDTVRARYAGFAILLVIVALLAVLLWYRQASLPVHEGTFIVPGLQQPVRIERDDHGIPNIIAASERDATFALGYTHAQDRLWQMEINRRIAAGRLAEAFGEGALDTDKFLRTIGIARTAQSIYQNLDAEHRDLLDAYAAVSMRT